MCDAPIETIIVLVSTIFGFVGGFTAGEFVAEDKLDKGLGSKEQLELWERRRQWRENEPK